jgi:serine/threonine-protein kinase HipA
MKDRTLSVTLPGRHVGDLVQSREGLTRWLPEKAWEAEGQHPRLGTDFLRNPGPRQRGTGLLPWFENLLPEPGSELRRRLCAAHGLRDGQSFALLGALGRDLTGAVEVATGAAPAGDASEGHIDAAEDAAPASLKLIQRLSSLAGMQLKFSMSMVKERLTLPARRAGGQWIVKLPGTEYTELPAIEQATMTWAQRAGFDVPRHFVVDVEHLIGIPAGWIEEGATHAFAVKRFDREDDGSKLHQEDLCQALDLPPMNKYGDMAPHVSLDGALRFVTDICGEPSGREMARRIGFAIASGNGDAHLKNWSLLWGNKTRPTLTPCYDLVATICWAQRLGWENPERPGGPLLALRVGGEHRFALFDDDVLAAHVKESGQPWASEELMAGIIRARDAWRHVEPEAPQAMRAALDTHWRCVPVLRHVGL